MDKKSSQLGMNVSTASGRLVKDILWSLIKETNRDICCKCGKAMKRDDFSIEHLTPWLHSENPLALFFDLNNISFSHRKCNSSDRRVTNRALCGTPSKYRSGCRCEDCTKASRDYKRSKYSSSKRRLKYERKGY